MECPELVARVSIKLGYEDKVLLRFLFSSNLSLVVLVIKSRRRGEESGCIAHAAYPGWRNMRDTPRDLRRLLWGVRNCR